MDMYTLTVDFIHRCIRETVEGLCSGLSRFSGASSVAFIYRLETDGELFVYDPEDLLRGHELKLKGYYLDNESLPAFPFASTYPSAYSEIQQITGLDIDGLLSFGGSSSTVPYQIWFTKHHPDMMSTGPTIRWLEYAALRFSHDIANRKELYTGISGSFIKMYAIHAIYNHLMHEVKQHGDLQLNTPFFTILESILEISKTREEGAWPFGRLGFIDSKHLDKIAFLASFVSDDLPRLDNPKHTRKLLQTVEKSNHALVSDGYNILGISDSTLPDNALTADFQGRCGFLRMYGETICSFVDGEYKSSSLRAKLYEVEEALLDYDLEPAIRDNLFYIISYLVHQAQAMRFGSTFVLDLGDTPAKLTGQLLQNPLDLKQPHLLNLACSLSKIDGALHIYKDQHLQGFACLLDGHSIAGEDRARGARYNSALRFTSKHPQSIVVVVSSDRPVSVIYNGVAFPGTCKWKALNHKNAASQPLTTWIESVQG